jgi:hypothetical protein
MTSADSLTSLSAPYRGLTNDVPSVSEPLPTTVPFLLVPAISFSNFVESLDSPPPPPPLSSRIFASTALIWLHSPSRVAALPPVSFVEAICRRQPSSITGGEQQLLEILRAVPMGNLLWFLCALNFVDNSSFC